MVTLFHRNPGGVGVGGRDRLVHQPQRLHWRAPESAPPAALLPHAAPQRRPPRRVCVRQGRIFSGIAQQGRIAHPLTQQIRLSPRAECTRSTLVARTLRPTVHPSRPLRCAAGVRLDVAGSRPLASARSASRGQAAQLASLLLVSLSLSLIHTCAAAKGLRKRDRERGLPVARGGRRDAPADRTWSGERGGRRRADQPRPATDS